jgi:hypothetical protein
MGARMLLFARAQGYTTAYSRASVFNYTSQKATRRNGWTVSGYALRVRGAKRVAGQYLRCTVPHIR